MKESLSNIHCRYGRIFGGQGEKGGSLMSELIITIGKDLYLYNVAFSWEINHNLTMYLTL